MRRPRLPASVRRYLEQPIVMTRGSWLAVVAVLGALAGAGVILAAIAIDNAGDAATRADQEREDRAVDRRAQLRRELEAKIASAQREAELAKRLAALETPSDRDLALAIRRLRRRASRNPELRRELGALGAALRSPTPTSTSPASAPRPPGRRPPPRTAPGPADRAPARPRPPSPGPGQPPAGGSPPSRPPVDVQTPSSITTPLGPVQLPRPTVCVPPLGGVDCG